MRLFTFLCSSLALALTSLSADPAPVNSSLVVDEDFEGTELGKGWHVNTGSWELVDGVLKGREIPDDHHAAAARRTVETGVAVYDLKFRLTGDAKAFHVGFDPAKGELDKKGHLFSVIVMPHSWRILKHVDKAKPEDDPNEILAQEKRAIPKDTWHTLRIVTWGQHVTAKLNDGERMQASHPTFGVRKPTVVFRCTGDGVEIDDLKVWVPKSR